MNEAVLNLLKEGAQVIKKGQFSELFSTCKDDANLAKDLAEALEQAGVDFCGVSSYATDRVEFRGTKKACEAYIEEQNLSKVADIQIINSTTNTLNESVLGGALLTGIGTSVGAGLFDIIRNIYNTYKNTPKKSRFIDYKGYVIEVAPDQSIRVYNQKSELLKTLYTVKQAKNYIKSLPKQPEITGTENLDIDDIYQ